MTEFKKIIISRTDSIGDVMLTLPMAGIIKAQNPNCEIIFIGKNYTEDVIACSENIDRFISWDVLQNQPFAKGAEEINLINADAVFFALPNKALAKMCLKADIPLRIGVANRAFHWLYCNERPMFSRKKSDLHESQLNLKLLEKHFNIGNNSLRKIATYSGFSSKTELSPSLSKFIDSNKKSVILHPKSQGSAIEWSLKNFQSLAEKLALEGYNVFVTGTEKEGLEIRPNFKFSSKIIDLSGKMTLIELIAFIDKCDVLVAASTGPLHLAAALNLHALGLYSCKRPIHPGRWAPIGKNADYLVTQNEEDSLDVITVDNVLNRIINH
ncbi:MAG: glycosyltransferase family 9 protein [Salibacteraceae bacterium]